YLVLPPSPHVCGQSYAWIVGPTDQDPAEAPKWLLELARRNGRRIAHAGTDGAVVPAGRRHDALVQFCGLLRAAGLGEAALVECGHAFLRHHVQHDPAKPLDLEHAERTMRSVARRYPPHPNRSAA
nr:bifunctional DNA primase/polymerase [Actinomycetota bacterium]